MIRAASIPLSAPAATIDLAGWPAGFPDVAALWRELHKGLRDPYRPERNYMRGPGPKWRERHGLPRANRPIASGKALERAGW